MVTVEEIDPLTDFAGLDGDVARGMVRARVRAAAAVAVPAARVARRASAAPSSAVTPRTSTASPRAPPRPAPSSASGSTRTPRRCRTGFPPTIAGVERFCRLVLDAAASRSRPRSSRTSRSSRRSAPTGWRRSSGSAPRSPAGVPVVADAKRGDIGTTAARHAAALFDVLGADAVTANPYLGSRGDRAAARADRPVRLRPLPDLQPGGGRAPGPRRRGRPGRRPRGSRRAAVRPGRTTSRGLGARRDGRPRRRRDGARRAGAGPGDRAGARRSSSRASVPRAVTRPRCSVTGRATAAPAGSAARRRPARQRVAGDHAEPRPRARPAMPGSGSPPPRPGGPDGSLC